MWTLVAITASLVRPGELELKKAAELYVSISYTTLSHSSDLLEEVNHTENPKEGKGKKNNNNCEGRKGR